MPAPPNLVLVGPTGAGKSSIGRRLAERLGLAFEDADRAIAAQAGASIAAVFEREGEAGFRAREAAMLAQLLAGEGRVVATGAGAVLDAGNRALLRARGFVVHLHVDVAGQLQRLARDHDRPLLRDADRETVLQDMARVRGPLYAEVADLRMDTTGLAPGPAAATLAGLLAGRWQAPVATTRVAP